jgi:ABC-2 type transport system permease protein
MRKIWVVIRREFVEKVRTKWFIISTVLGPVMMAAFIVVPMQMAEREATERSIRILDASTSEFGRRIEDLFAGPVPVRAEWIGVAVPQMAEVADSLNALVGAKALDGYLIVTDATASEGEAEYRGSNVSSQADMQVLEQALSEAVLTARLAGQGVGADASGEYPRRRGDGFVGAGCVRACLCGVDAALPHHTPVRRAGHGCRG